MSAELGRVPEPVGWIDNRNFIVPPDIIPVRRVSPIRQRPRTLCRPCPEGTPVCRAGGREWLSDHGPDDVQARDHRNAYGTSFTAHASCLIGLLVLLAGPDAAPPTRATSALRMPAYVAVPSGGSGAPPLTQASAERPSGLRKNHVVRPAARKKAPEASAVAPTRADQSLERDPEPTIEAAAPPESALDTADTSTPADARASEASTAGAGGEGGDGRGSGTGAGSGSGSGVGMSPGPYRLGHGIEPPRKIKHVAPIYPAGALALRALGTVVIEAVVGTDGKVHDTKIVQSIASLDQAALDAVRQWEFAPSTLNGFPVAVIVTVLVQFAIH